MNYTPKYLSWDDVENLCKKICDDIKKDRIEFNFIVPVLKGGFFPSMLIAKNFNIDNFSCIQIRGSNSNLINSDFHEPKYLGCTNSEALKGVNVLICEDIVYSGATLDVVVEKLKMFGVKKIYTCTLYNFCQSERFGKIYHGNIQDDVNWIVFPWDYEHPYSKLQIIKT